MAIAAAAVFFSLSNPAQALLAVLGSQPLFSATWNDTGSDYNDQLNWTPNNVPNFDAIFSGTPSFPVEITAADTFVQRFSFLSTAGAYTIQTTSGMLTLGEVVNASANTQTFNVINGGSISFGDNALLPTGITINVNDGVLWFYDKASAGNALINISSTAGVFANFLDQSSAGSATITNDNTLAFFDNSTAANANITNNRYLQFFNNSSAGNATFTNWDNTSFFDNSTAGTSNFTNNSVLAFYGNSTAANATITNWDRLSFSDSSTAGNATITNMPLRLIEFNNSATAADATFKSDGTINFNDTSTAANAKFENYFGATINFNGLTSTAFSTAANAKFESYGTINFYGYSTAANATFTNNGDIYFFDTSTAANAKIENNGLLTFDGSATAAFANIINNCCLNFVGSSTAGFATINNFGTVTFDDNSTAANATIANRAFGQIFFTGVSTAANATITNDENGYIAFADSTTAGSATIRNSGIIEFSGNTNAGTANITITPTGALAFFGSANAANATIVNSSAFPTGLIFADVATAGNATITTTAGAYTIFTDFSTGGNARFITTGNGIVDFSEPFGGSTKSAGSIEGTGTFIIGGTTFTVGSNNLSTTVDGVIGDSVGCGCPNPAGDLVKIGTGTLTLNGINSYTGFTQVQDGALIINGSITSNTSVFAGALLGGNGMIFGNVNVGGILAPGNSIGTMTVNGNLDFGLNAIYRVDVTGPTQRDQTIVSGNISVDLGATVQVRAFNGGNGFGQSARLSILTSTGGVVTSTFAGVTDDLLFYDSALDYDAQNVYLLLTRNAQTFAPFALTPNQRAVAAALDAAGANNNVYAAFQNTPEGVQRALDLLSGELFATLPGMFIDESAIFRNAIFARLRNTAFTGFTGPLGYLSEQDEKALAYTQTNRGNPFRALRPANRGYEYWAQAFGSWAKYESDSNAGSAKRATGGVIAGLDKMLTDGIRAGLSVGYANTQARITDRASKANADTFHLAAYLSKLDGRWSYRTGVALAAHSVNSERAVIADTLRAEYFAVTGQMFGEVGYAIAARQFALEPFANLSLVHHYAHGFTETGATSALTTDGTNKTLGFTTIGMRIATRYDLANGWALMPRSMVGWQHAIGALTPTRTLTFQSTGTGMTIAGTPLSRDMLLAETGFDVRISATQLLGFFYSATVANDSTEQAVRGKYEWKF